MIKTNNKYNIKFPDEIIVDDTNEVLYRTQEGKLKGNKNSVRCANNIVHNNFPNKPMKGWKILSYFEGYKGKYSRIYITNSNSIKINIRADYMFDIIMTNLTVIEGEIQEPCVIGFDQSNCPMLIPESHEYYQGALYPNPDLSIPTCAKDLIVGAAYDIKGVKSTYIGELKKGLRIDYFYDITIGKQKFYVFFEEMSGQVTFRTNIGKTLVNNTISADDKSQDQCNNILESVKKLAINSENGKITSIEFDLSSIKGAKDNKKYENEVVYHNGKQYGLKDCFIYLEQESPTKINILVKPGNDNYIKVQEIIFDTKCNRIKVNTNSIAKDNYSTKISEITGIDSYVPSKPVQKLFNLISDQLTIGNIGHGPYVFWNTGTQLTSNLNLITASGKVFPKQLISNCIAGSGSVRSLKL